MVSLILERIFFQRPPDVVAQDLVGSLMIVRTTNVDVTARIVETEAYAGSDDPASHAYRGRTPRTAAMFGPAGHLYVYRSYGVHWCMNVVTGPDGAASAVLLRAAEVYASPRDVGRVTAFTILSGPGNLTRGLGIDGSQNETDCCDKTSTVTFRAPPSAIVAQERGQSQRIGLSKGQDRLSRYFLVGSPALSGARRYNTVESGC
jgi:DNA-3-methyladenine glycosylase